MADRNGINEAVKNLAENKDAVTAKVKAYRTVNGHGGGYRLEVSMLEKMSFALYTEGGKQTQDENSACVIEPEKIYIGCQTDKDAIAMLSILKSLEKRLSMMIGEKAGSGNIRK